MKYLIVFFLLFISCKDVDNKKEVDVELFNKVIGTLIPDTDRSRYVVVLPADGCSGCDKFVIKKLYEKLNEIDPSDFQIIISGIHGKLLLEDSDLSTEDFKIIEDREANFVRYGLISIYPKIFKKSNDVIEGWEIRASTKEQDFQNWINQL